MTQLDLLHPPVRWVFVERLDDEGNVDQVTRAVHDEGVEHVFVEGACTCGLMDLGVGE